MSDVRQHVDAVKNLAASFRSMIALGDYLEGIASLEQQEREAQDRTAAARTARDQAEADLVAARARVADAETDVATARTSAAAIVAGARAEAKAHLEEYSASHAQLVENAETEKAALYEGIQLRERQLADLGAAVDRKTAELATLEAKFVALKQQAAAFGSA